MSVAISTPHARAKPAAIGGALLPLAGLIQRELLRTLRSGRMFGFVMLLALLFGATAYFCYPPEAPFHLSTLGGAARNLTSAFIGFVLVAAGLLIPAMAGTAVPAEREQNTFDMMATSLLRPSVLALGIIANSTGVFLLVLVALLPVLAVTFFMVGLEWQGVLLACAMILLASISTAAVCVAVSTRARTSLQALVGSYAATALWHGGHVFLIAMFGLSFLWLALGLNPDPMVAKFSSELAEILTFALVTPAAVMLALETIPTSAQVAAFAVYHILLTAASVAVTPWLLRPADRRGSVAAASRRSKRRKNTKTAASTDPIRDGQNPVYARERHWAMGQRFRGKRAWLGWGALLILTGLVIYAQHYPRDFRMSKRNLIDIIAYWPNVPLVRIFGINASRITDAVEQFFLFMIPIVSVLVPLYIAPLFTREHEQNSMEMLRASLLRPRQIVSGKMRAGLMTMAPIWLGATLALLPFLPKSALYNAWPVLLGLLSALISIIYTLGLTVYIAARSSKTSTAVVMIYAVAIGQHLVLPFAVIAWYELILYAPSRQLSRTMDLVLGFCAPLWSYYVHIVDGDYIDIWGWLLAIYLLLGIMFTISGLRAYMKIDE